VRLRDVKLQAVSAESNLISQTKAEHIQKYAYYYYYYYYYYFYYYYCYYYYYAHAQEPI